MARKAVTKDIDMKDVDTFEANEKGTFDKAKEPKVKKNDNVKVITLNKRFSINVGGKVIEGNRGDTIELPIEVYNRIYKFYKF